MALALRKLESGAYVTQDDRWLVVRRDSLDEWESVSSVWVAGDYGPGNASEKYWNQRDEVETFEADTRRQVVEWLEKQLQA